MENSNDNTGFELILPFLRPIQHLILDPEISEIMVNGPEHVFIETQRASCSPCPMLTLSPKSLEVAVRNIARRLGDDISEEKPVLDSRLPDGSRVAAVMPPCSLNGVTLTIRKFNAKHFGIEDLIQIGTLTQELAEVLALCRVLDDQNEFILWDEIGHKILETWFYRCPFRQSLLGYAEYAQRLRSGLPLTRSIYHV